MRMDSRLLENDRERSENDREGHRFPFAWE